MNVGVVTGVVIAVSVAIVEESDTSANSEVRSVPVAMALTAEGGLIGALIAVVIPEDGS